MAAKMHDDDQLISLAELLAAGVLLVMVTVVGTLWFRSKTRGTQNQAWVGRWRLAGIVLLSVAVIINSVDLIAFRDVHVLPALTLLPLLVIILANPRGLKKRRSTSKPKKKTTDHRP